jgi:hypothetical protein
MQLAAIGAITDRQRCRIVDALLHSASDLSRDGSP